jgi:hypothetical protein
MTNPMPESSCKMTIVAKAAGVRNFAEGELPLLIGLGCTPAQLFE